MMYQIFQDSEAEIEKRKATEDYVETRDVASLQAILNTEEGRWFIKRIFDMTMVFMPFDIDVDKMLYQEGRRRIGLDLRNKILSLKNGPNLLHKIEAEGEAHEKQIREITDAIERRYED